MFSSQATQKKTDWRDCAQGWNRTSALAVLREATDNCLERDMQTDEVLSALAYLAARSPRAYVFHRFRNALGIVDAGTREVAVRNAYDGAERYLTGGHKNLAPK
jgi:hypothetical protein